ncbi:MAG: hypothetical protein ACRCY4_06295 [Brevinema sp.]
MITSNFVKAACKKTAFVVLSTQLLYLTIHLQFLLGMPQAGLAVVDSLFFLFVGIGLFILFKGNKFHYFLSFAIVLFPIVILQYFYIKIFNKPFLLSEVHKFPTLLQVSTWPLRIFYVSVTGIWILGLLYLIFISIKNLISLNIIQKIIPVAILIYYIFYIMQTSPREFWIADPNMTFYMKGILKTIKSESQDLAVEFSSADVISSFNYLKEKEKERVIYPISASPSVVPVKKRPIFMIVFESLYDYKHFLPLFDEDPFPKEYRELVKSNNYSGPNQAHGSFDARFVSLTGAIPFQPAYDGEPSDYQALPNILSSYGYDTTALESVNATYSLPTYYKLWGFSKIYFELFGNDWAGKRLVPTTYENNITKIIMDTPDDVVPFYFGFTYLGHGGSEAFTDRIPDPKTDISAYLALFNQKDQRLPKQLLKANIFNAERVVSIKKMILEKYPDALIVLKSDHYSVEFHQSLNGNNNIPAEYKEKFRGDPNVLPFIVIDGTNGVLPLKEGFSPENIPLLILAEAGLPYANTTASLLFRDLPEDKITIYNRWYEKQGDSYLPLEMSKDSNPDLLEYKYALDIISQDLYRNKKAPLTLQLLKENP